MNGYPSRMTHDFYSCPTSVAYYTGTYYLVPIYDIVVYTGRMLVMPNERITRGGMICSTTTRYIYIPRCKAQHDILIIVSHSLLYGIFVSTSPCHASRRSEKRQCA